MGRFETETLALPQNREALADLNGQWIDRFHDRNGLELRPCFRTPGYFTPVHERGTKRDTIDGSIRTSIRQQRLSGFMNRARHRAALPGSLVSPARS